MASVANIESHAEPHRFGIALAAGVLLWLAILFVFSRLLSPPTADSVQAPPIDAKIIELPAPKPTPQPSVPQPRRIERPPPKPAVKPRAEEPVAVRPKPVPAPPAPQVTPPADKTAAQPVAKADAMPKTPAPPSNADASPGTAHMGAKAIYQPAPKIPDDLRDEAISLVALARFHVKPDGSADVELLKATSSPRINQLILNTLRTWKFFPALEQGKPVPSVQDIRIHIDVS
jgi:protein TonB